MENQTPQTKPQQFSLEDEKTWLLIASASPLLGFLIPIGNIVGPLVVWLYKRDTMPRLAHQALEALNFQISVTIYVLVSFMLTFVLIGFPLMFLVILFDIIMVIKAIIDAANGKDTHYPLTIRLVK